MPLCEDDKAKLKGHQLSSKDQLTKEQYGAISTLIYETDPYIYPALFESNLYPLEAANKILPYVFMHGNDGMFCKENLYVYMLGENIVGLILWHKGPMKWSSKLFYLAAQDAGVQLVEENVIAVSNGYVDDKYSEGTALTEHSLSLINICIDRRMRGRGIGRRMMTDFLHDHLNEQMELCVLADNIVALRLYEKMGFKIVNETQGFSMSDQKPKVYDMKRL